MTVAINNAIRSGGLKGLVYCTRHTQFLVRHEGVGPFCFTRRVCSHPTPMKGRPCEDRDSGWNDAPTNLRIQTASRSWKRQKTKSLLELWREHSPTNTLTLDIWPPEM
ncbi:unnamed protein product [Nyctereutes procyonoides]|uniref:(raccoon dog) hypothetical protein n=1 Tax=Nyctereutes procyonoides TaxID=34880 RepID=A0A811YEX4_NYCPR|nr:unnamed protein product [Nyctereutes procyonoides]